MRCWVSLIGLVLFRGILQMAAEIMEALDFQRLVELGGNREAGVAAALELRNGDEQARFKIASLCLYVATVAPEALADIYDGLCEGWLGREPQAPRISAPAEPATVPAEAWRELWAIVLDPHAGDDPSLITVRTTALTSLLEHSFHTRVAAMSHLYPDVDVAASQGTPPKFQLEDLARCPKDSLGGLLHGLVVDKGFDLEVLDRDGIGLDSLPVPLPYLNVRILQCHDIWHFVGGYETTSLHEVAISGFQMGQFGHHYSSMFLGVVLAQVAFIAPVEATGFLLDTVLSSYVHGRETPPLMAVPWEEIWDQTLENIRLKLGVTAYERPYPASLIEDLRAAS